jgi:SagB-type dehydrogenase family enzyme
LLYYSAGLKTKKINKHVGRFYPSAGARYPLELYIVSLNSQLPRALYHYYPKEHGLEKMWLYNENQIALCFDQDWIKKASIILLISAVFKRTTTKYGDRGYRHVLIESGHMGQNIYLISSALNLSCCSIGGFFDLKLNRLLEVDGVEEAIIYAFAIGHAL